MGIRRDTPALQRPARDGESNEVNAARPARRDGESNEVRSVREVCSDLGRVCRRVGGVGVS